MSENTIIIKASDYRYPSRDELKAVYKVTPELSSFGYVSEYPFISLASNERTIHEVHRDDHLQYWDGVLLNRNGALAHTYENAIVHFTRGIPDKIKAYEHQNYINRMQFDYYAEIFYYHFATVKDTIAQLLNVYYQLGFDISKIYFKDILIKIPNQKVKSILTNFARETELTTKYRNSYTHRTPINYPDTRSSIKLEESKLIYGSAPDSFVKSAVIKANLNITIHSVAKMLSELKKLLPQKI